MARVERVTYVPSPLTNGEYIPRIAYSNTDDVRDFTSEDMNRVLDYDHLPDPPPPDAALGHLEFELDDDATINDDAPPKFPKRYCCLRGSFIFYYSMEDVKIEGGTNSNVGSRYGGRQGEATFTGPPLGVVPLERVMVEFPAGGRRVFREHAKTNARNGYEIMIRHVARGGPNTIVASSAGAGAGAGAGGGAGADDNASVKTSTNAVTKRRAPAYLVMDSLGQRDLWADAIRIRADVYKKDTKLRAAGVVTNNNPPHEPDSKGTSNALTIDTDASGRRGYGGYRRQNTQSPAGARGDGTTMRRGTMSGGIGGEISLLAGVIDASEQKDIDQALDEFGRTALFNEDTWVNTFFQTHDELEAGNMCEQLERWQSSIKKGLRGAVLEQYEYFVEASREMTIMGREVANLKDMVTKQVETFESMKNIDFDLDVGGDHDLRADTVELEDDTNDYSSDDDDGDQIHRDEESKSRKSGKSKQHLRSSPLLKDSLSPSSSRSKFSLNSKSIDGAEVEVPSWLDDAVEEISAFVKECRYTDATDLLLKTKTEVAGIIDLNDRLTEKKLSKKQLSSLHRMQRSIDDLSNRLCERLSEGLRRKNEALKQTAKKERADPLTAMAPLVSPIALSDDATALHLLVKLGRPQDAATAYSTRRSLLLNECLHERPICNTNTTNNVDVVIYAAQLSHSFFNCLATSVEGFLDLFSELDKGTSADDQSETSSINTSSLKGVPANALAATCLWCDSELSKFASVFGSKVLGNLTLSPRDGASSNRITERITQFETVADIAHLKNQLRAAEEMGEYAAAGKLRKKIAIQEQEEKDGTLGHKVLLTKSSNNKERKTAIEIASKCIDQTFEFATEFLNTIGLPLTPRLAEYLRTRLKGTEAEIATEIEHKWDHIIFDWKLSISNATYDAIRKSTSED